MPPQPPWKPLLSHHLALLSPATFTLATVSASGHPRCRTMIYRGFLGELPANPHTPLPNHNPRIMSSWCLTFTTDARTPKTSELGNSSVEAVFWIASDTTTGESIQNQWRIRGACHLFGEEDVGVERYLERTGEGDWSWTREFQAHWANLAPRMRGSFNNPVPGRPVSEGGVGGRKGLVVADEDVLKADREEARARGNMRVGVIVPERVERVDLEADEKKARRWVWERDAEGAWREEEVWP